MQSPRKAVSPPPNPLEQVGAAGRLLRFFYQFTVGLAWVYETIIKPVTWPIWRLFGKLFNRYRAFWDKHVYLASGHFSKVRAGIMIVCTVAFFYFLVPTLGFMFDATMFLATYEKEDIYLTFSQEIDPVQNLHSVKGCEGLPCTEANSVYYRVREDHFNSIWSILRHGHLFYPDYVAAAVPSGISKCSVTSYGLRLKFAMRQWDIYPDMLEAHCQPLAGQ